MSKQNIDAWRLVAVCSHCGAHKLLFRNVPERLSHIAGKYSTICERCGLRDSFQVARVPDIEERQDRPEMGQISAV